MTFGSFPILVVVAGGLALVALFYVLQRLRVRHRDVEVVTLLFWREAIDEAQVRVRTRVFKHWPAYLLVLAAAVALWAAAAEPRLAPRDGRRHVVLLDGSAAMATGDTYARALEAAGDLARSLPADRRTVLRVGGTTETLLGPNEPIVLLAERGGATASAAPGGLARAARAIAQRATVDAPLTVHVVTAEAVDTAGLADTASFALRTVPVTREDAANAGVIAIGVDESTSGRWDTVDVYVEVAGAPAEAVDVDVDGTSLEVVREGAGRLVARDVAALGGVLTATVRDGGALAMDDTASLALPRRPRIDVAVAPDVPDAVRAVLEIDRAVRIVTGTADVVVRGADSAFGGSRPALELTDVGAAFTIDLPGDEDPAAAMSGLIDELALASIDSTELATVAGRAITLDIIPTDGPRRVGVWRSLVGDGFDFTSSRAFPLFLAGAVRWLANQPALVPYVAVGEGVAPRLADAAGRADGLGLPVAATAAGRVELADERSVLAALQAPGVTTASAPAATATPGDVAGGMDTVSLLGALAALLLAIEWMLVNRGRMP